MPVCIESRQLLGECAAWDKFDDLPGAEEVAVFGCC